MEEDEVKEVKVSPFDFVFNHLDPFGQLKEYDNITGNVYLGGQGALTQQFITQKQIGSILTVMDKKSYDRMRWQQKIQNFESVHQHMFINIKDNQDAYIAPYFEQTNAFIKQALENQSNLFVHCKGGMSRSPTILSAYLMSTYGKTFEEIYAFLRRKRTVVGINPNFQQQLRDYNVKLHGGVVEERPKQETKKGDQMQEKKFKRKPEKKQREKTNKKQLTEDKQQVQKKLDSLDLNQQNKTEARKDITTESQTSQSLLPEST